MHAELENLWVCPANVGVNGCEHVFFNMSVELNIAHYFGSLVCVDELGVCDKFSLRPVHGGFSLIVQPVEDR